MRNRRCVDEAEDVLFALCLIPLHRYLTEMRYSQLSEDNIIDEDYFKAKLAWKHVNIKFKNITISSWKQMLYF